ncbi:Mitochondrial fusion and transport protein UGO1 [Spathaspora sp. JA1]|nr:Mitochondrial fusion and transport protein UGO1 [Spathaspora sp. JA1]
MSSQVNTLQLRPYYDHDTFDAGYSVIFKKGVGLIDTQTNKPITAKFSASAIDQAINKSGSGGVLSKAFGRNGGIGISSVGDSSASGTGMFRDKNYIYDLEFSEYFDFHNLVELFKNLFWNFIKNYTKVLLSQPLEIVRLVLQVGKFEFKKSSEKPQPLTEISKPKRLLNDEQGEFSSPVPYTTEEDYDDDDTIDYFQSNIENIEQSVWSNEQSRQQLDSYSDSKKKKRSKHRSGSRINKIQPKSIHTLDIMSAIVNKDGPFALFRGINASFIYQTLSHTIEAWITGFISPFLGIPDPFFLDLTHSNDPFKSLWLSVSACVLTGLVLIPLDLIRVRLMVTQFNSSVIEDKIESVGNSSNDLKEDETTESIIVEQVVQSTRSVRESIRNFPVYYLSHPPTPIVCLTILHQFSITIFRKIAPYILFIKFNIDSYSSPNIYTFVNLLSLIMEFFIKLPVENLLRKEQVRFLLTTKSEDLMKVITIENPQENLIIQFNGKVNENDENDEETPTTFLERVKQMGLFNGWRVGVLNVIGFWGYNIIKNDGTELKEERL